MKKLIILAVILLSLTGCTAKEHTRYVMSGHYYNGYVIRDDGHVWDYATIEVEPNSPVYIFFDDNGTPNKVTDDFIFNIITDYEKLNS